MSSAFLLCSTACRDRRWTFQKGGDKEGVESHFEHNLNTPTHSLMAFMWICSVPTCKLALVIVPGKDAFVECSQASKLQC